MQSPRHPTAGFTLIELSIVLLIVGLLAGQWLPSFQQQQLIQQRQIATAHLEAARAALVSYAVLHQSLPCPDYSQQTQDPHYGEAASVCSQAAMEGWLPFKTLGIREQEASDSPLDGDPSRRFLYRVDPAFTLSQGQTIRLSTPFSLALAIFDQAGNKLTSDAERPVAILAAAGADGVFNGENASFEAVNGHYEAHPPQAGFDDQLIWLGRPTLFGSLLRAGVDITPP